MGIIPAIITAIASVASAGTGIGLELSNQPSTPKISTTPTTTPLTTGQSAAVKSAISGQDANIQAQTGGSLSPDYLTQIAPILSGTAGPGVSGIAQGATNSFTGSNPIAQVLRTLSAGGGGGAPSASAQSFQPAGLTAQPGSAAGDYVDSGLSSLYKSLGLAG